MIRRGMMRRMLQLLACTGAAFGSSPTPPKPWVNSTEGIHLFLTFEHVPCSCPAPRTGSLQLHPLPSVFSFPLAQELRAA